MLEANSETPFRRHVRRTLASLVMSLLSGNCWKCSGHCLLLGLGLCRARPAHNPCLATSSGCASCKGQGSCAATFWGPRPSARGAKSRRPALAAREGGAPSSRRGSGVKSARGIVTRRAETQLLFSTKVARRHPAALFRWRLT